MTKRNLKPLEAAMLAFMVQHGDSTEEDIRAGTLLTLHGMEYRGGGWEAAMADVRERIAVMDLLRTNGAIGRSCIEDGVIDHYPELCLTEERHTGLFEERFMGKGTEDDDPYLRVVSAARISWAKRYEEDIYEGQQMQARLDAWMDWSWHLYA